MYTPYEKRTPRKHYFEDVIVETRGRHDFCALFAGLAAAIDPKHFDAVPLVFIAGGPESGKSLAADVMFEALDDETDKNAVSRYWEEVSGKFSREAYGGSAMSRPLVFPMQSGGLKRHFMFQSGFGYENDYQRLKPVQELYEQSGGKSGVIIVTGNLCREYRSTSLFVDVGFEQFHNSRPRAAMISVPHGSPFENCPRFSGVMDNLRSLER